MVGGATFPSPEGVDLPFSGARAMERHDMSTETLKSSTLSATLRTTTGKGFARRLRGEQKKIPAIVYGGKEPVSIAVDPLALRLAIKTPHKFNTLLTLQIEGGGERKTLLKDYQQDPVTRALLHADFFEVAMDKPITVPVPIVLVGTAKGAKEGGILQQARRELDVTCLPKDIPEKIEVDVTELEITDALHVADVKAPAGCKIRFASNYTVALVAIPEKEEIATPVVAAAAVAGAAPAAAADGKAAPAAAGGKAAPAAAGDKKAAAPAKK